MGVMFDAIALDLNGTLISNGFSLFPRPGLHALLETCREVATHIVVFTGMRQARAEQVVATLVRDGHAPTWFAEVDILADSEGAKDLRHVCEDPSRALLLDNSPENALPNQRDRLLQVATFAHPYPDDDRELERAACALRALVGACGPGPSHRMCVCM